MSQSLINQGNILTFAAAVFAAALFLDLSQSLINQGNILTCGKSHKGDKR